MMFILVVSGWPGNKVYSEAFSGKRAEKNCAVFLLSEMRGGSRYPYPRSCARQGITPTVSPGNLHQKIYSGYKEKSNDAGNNPRGNHFSRSLKKI